MDIPQRIEELQEYADSLLNSMKPGTPELLFCVRALLGLLAELAKTRVIGDTPTDTDAQGKG